MDDGNSQATAQHTECARDAASTKLLLTKHGVATVYRTVPLAEGKQQPEAKAKPRMMTTREYRHHDDIPSVFAEIHPTWSAKPVQQPRHVP
jgi:hypothetical protein